MLKTSVRRLRRQRVLEVSLQRERSGHFWQIETDIKCGELCQSFFIVFSGGTRWNLSINLHTYFCVTLCKAICNASTFWLGVNSDVLTGAHTENVCSTPPPAVPWNLQISGGRPPKTDPYFRYF